MSVAPDANRLQVLRSTQLLDSAPEPAFDRLTRLAAHLTGAPIALVSLVDDRRQFFKSSFGLKEPLATQRGTALSHSFCRHVAHDRAPLVVADAREHSALRDNPVIRDHNVIAYAGVPLVIDEEAIGALCVIDDKPHVWHADSIRVLEDLAASVVSEIRLRMAQRDVDFYAALARNLPRGAVVLFDRELRCLAVEGGLLRTDGVSPRALIGRSMRDIAGYSAGDPGFDRVDELYRQALAGESAATDFENGGRMLALNVAPVRDAAGEIIAGIVLAMDVTHERQLESALRRSEQIHRAIVQNLPNGAVFMFDRDMRYVSADGPLLSDMMRRTDLDSIVGRRVADIVSPVNRDAVLEQYRRALAGERSNSEIERDGRFFEVSVVPIFEGDQINHALVSSYDVTDRRREALELRQARDSFAREQALLDTALAHIADGVALIDADNRLLVANRAFGEMMALSADQVTGLSRERFVRHVAPLLATPEGFADALVAQPENVSQEFVFARPRRRILTRTWTSVGAGRRRRDPGDLARRHRRARPAARARGAAAGRRADRHPQPARRRDRAAHRAGPHAARRHADVRGPAGHRSTSRR